MEADKAIADIAIATAAKSTVEEATVNTDNESEDVAEIEKKEEAAPRPYYVYLLSTLDEKSTYIGATVDVHHRLRQHNGEIKGGAKYTTSRGKNNWKRILYVTGFPTWPDALRFEWRWKQLCRKAKVKKGSSIDRRKRALQQLLELPRATTAAMPYLEWPSGGPSILYG
jgi:predicted GIY-YIG superfamily endonuclease